MKNAKCRAGASVRTASGSERSPASVRAASGSERSPAIRANARSAFFILHSSFSTAACLLALLAAPPVAFSQLPGTEPAPPDAIILLWEQHWTLAPDGSQVYHERQHVRLDSDRAYGEFADPKIVYDPRTQTLEVLTARVRMRDGAVLEPPEYSWIEVAPRGPAGWPSFADLRQKVLVMSGIEPGCTVELEYRLTTRPGARSALAADVRVDHRYPVERRLLRITTPADAALSVAARSATGGEIQPRVEEADGATTRTWSYAALPAAPDWPQCPPWTRRSPRLTFTTDAAGWLQSRLDALATAADESPLLAQLAAEWTRDAADDEQRMRRIQEKLAASFNFVNFDVAWRPERPRRASEAIEGNYGLPAESAAVLLAVARAAGLAVHPALLVEEDSWVPAAPQDALVAAYVVVRTENDRVEIWHPQRGRIQRSAAWNGCMLLARPGQPFDGMRLHAFTDASESRCDVSGTITLAADGAYTGEVTLRATGMFVSEDSLRTRDAQRLRAQALIRRVLPEAAIEDFTIRALTVSEAARSLRGATGVFEVSAMIKSGKPLEKAAGARRLVLGDLPPGAADAPLPLAYTTLPGRVRVAGAFQSTVDMRIHWPAEWSLESAPPRVARLSGSWGHAGQTVERLEHGLRIERTIAITEREISPDALFTLRAALNEMASEPARTVLLR